MRYRNAMLLCALPLFAAVLSLLRVDQAAGQQAAPPRPTSSLELGQPYDLEAQARFEAGLNEVEVRGLVMLRSRYVLADRKCPVPPTGEVFALKLRGDMTRALARRLDARGVSFIGYAWPHTHFLRVGDHSIAEVLKDTLVEGTLAIEPMDRMAPDVYAKQDQAGEYAVEFWADVSIEQAAVLLDDVGAIVVDGKLGGTDATVTLSLTGQGLKRLLASPLVEYVSPRSHTETTNQVSAAMANATPAIIGVNPYNLDGNGQVAAVFDAGVARSTHEQYQGLSGVSVPSNWPGSGRVHNMDSTLHSHAAHVTGTIVGDGTNNASARGYAYRALCLVHEWNGVDARRRDAKHNFNHVADNHSYASFSSPTWAAYNGDTRTKDRTNRDILGCMVQSAGNYANYSPSGTKPFGDSNPTCSIPSANAHRNGFIIAAAEDNEDIADFSSRGPGLDGRLIPQFCANGVSLDSTGSSSNTNYYSASGTSMSGPSVCGSVVLLAQLWRREHSDQVFSPDVARAVLAQTCRDKYHPGPDYRYGFGIVDVQAASDLILADKASGGRRIFRGTTRSGKVQEYTFTVSSADPIHIVLSWLDVHATSGAAVSMVNDLDIELEDPNGGIHYPWRGVNTASTNDHTYAFTNNGPNQRDNLELVHVDNPITGTWILRVKGTSVPANPQTGVPNDETGWVVASSHQVNLEKIFRGDAVNGSTPVAIPDNSTAGLTRTFNVSDPRVITGVRVFTRIKHQRRGDLSVTLQAPGGGPTVTLKSTNNGVFNTEYSLIAVFPDTKQEDDPMTALYCLPVNGTWTVRIRDTVASNTGELQYLAIEFDVRTNNAPSSNAGADFDVRENAPGQLSGSGSDADGDPISYEWSQLSGNVTLALNSTTIANPSFTAPWVTQDEPVVMQLTVRDCAGAFTTDSVTVTVRNNASPVANAGADFGVLGGDPVQLDGSASTDAESDPLTYSWVQTSGTPVTLAGAGTMLAGFSTLPVTSDEQLEFELTVTDDRGDFTTDTVRVTIEANRPPVANAGPDQGAVWSAMVTLDGTASSDPNTGDALTYLWAQVGGTNPVVLVGDTTATPTFTAPAVDDRLVFELTVIDRYGLSATDRVVVHVNETGALPKKSSGGKKKSGGGGGCTLTGGAAWSLAVLGLLAWLRKRRD
ncbi:MAG: S8 family serine peptidase [Planctomycetes bacterium]|nr:S8 family serine peptidase [Planctomycetota bacterium]MCW8134731.1 S8 family serine peptidase [Planctomycetota bacterium]